MMSSIYGYRVTGKLRGVKFDEFVLDESLLSIVHVSSDYDRFVLEKAIKCAANIGSTTFHDEALSVEVITHASDAPRFVILRGIKDGNRFYSRYSAEDRWETCKLDTGKVAYEILGFADSTAEVHRKMWRSEHPTFPTMFQLSASSDLATHQHHCCAKHGCKYGDVWCPVATTNVPQLSACGICLEDE